MKYRDLISFEPIESVVQLREADSPTKARKLVETFVISDRMADQLADLVFPNLRFDQPGDNKGILIVGNYGTGKSHLMSLISALAEHADLADAVRNSKVAQAAKPLAGKFKVIRMEIGATKMSLRDIICGTLEDALSEMGVSYTFPPADKVRENKNAFIEMMAAFSKKFPDHGLLLLVDELLDYLRSRDDQAVILDLNFLREVGEVCRLIRFRFLAGLQESLFENPRFKFVAESVRRVRDRFEQLRIVRQDVAYVVSERLLKKTPKQQAWIRQHLEKFTPMYGGMAERIDEFVRLFPIHPVYLETFEKLSIAEKREVLKTITAEMRRLLDLDVPTDETGLVSYDSYWAHLRENAVLKSIPDVGEVINKSKVLEDRIKQAFTKPAYRPMAMRLCCALSVQRLATDDIYAKIGPTPTELRDGLCLYLPIPEKTADFLLTSVEACLKEIVRTMSGSLISRNEDNGQFFLDLKKDIDYDGEIEKRGESLSKSQLDRYYFDALTRVLELTDVAPYVSGYRIWEHEVEWREHKVTRRGYLFFGAPNERSTAQPPRDFYAYFLQPFQPPAYTDAKLADEVFFSLTEPDEEFLRTLRLYAGAREMASQSGSNRKIYEEKADGHLKALTNWLRQNMLAKFQVIHQGVPKKMVDVLKGHRTGNATIREMVNLVGSVYLAPQFAEKYPDYPKFGITITTTNIALAAEDAARAISGGLHTNTATAVLDGLELLEGDKIKPHGSRYGKAILKKLAAKPHGQVVNRKELVIEQTGVEIEADHKLEPELLVVVLLALVHSGDIVLTLVGRKLDAGNLSDAARISAEELVKFKHIEKPKGVPVGPLVALFEMLGLSEGLIRNPDTHEEAVIQLHDRVAKLVDQVVTVKQAVQSGFPCWGSELISAEDREKHRQKLDDLQTFLERLQAFNTPGKLKNFTYTVEDIQAQEKNLKLMQELEALGALAAELAPLTSYITTATALLPESDPWVLKTEEAKTDWRTQLLDPIKRSAPDFRQKILKALEKIKKDYQDHYLGLHQKARLNVTEDEKKRNLMRDPRLERLSKLAGVALLSHASLTDLQTRLASLKPCYTLVKDDLASNPVCPHCGFRPTEESAGPSGSVLLGQFDDEIDKLSDNWTKTLLENLDDPTAQQSIDLLSADQKKAVKKFLKDKTLPEKVGNDLVQGIQNALKGLDAITVKPSDLIATLGDSNSPCTVEQLKNRFDDFVQQLVRGKDVSKIRIVIEKLS